MKEIFESQYLFNQSAEMVGITDTKKLLRYYCHHLNTELDEVQKADSEDSQKEEISDIILYGVNMALGLGFAPEEMESSINDKITKNLARLVSNPDSFHPRKAYEEFK